MQLKSLSLFATIILSSNLYANAAIQGGDIAEGKRFNLNKVNDIVSYYKDGSQGNAFFSCFLGGDRVAATVYPGKNFMGNVPHLLTPGNNGPYSWTLRNWGASNGNIKVKLIRGSNASIQCQSY